MSLLTSSYDALVKDDFVTRIIVLSTMLISSMLLIAQMTMMNRTYLAIMGYISGEWALVTDDNDNIAGNDTNANSNSNNNNSNEPTIFQSFYRLKLWIYDLFGIGTKPIHSPPLRRSNSTLMHWDPKRRYQKGDRIAYGDSIYEAMSNSPEGPPFDPFLRAAHDIFRDELGHPSTSHVLASLSVGCLALASGLFVIMLVWICNHTFSQK